MNSTGTTRRSIRYGPLADGGNHAYRPISKSRERISMHSCIPFTSFPIRDVSIFAICRHFAPSTARSGPNPFGRAPAGRSGPSRPSAISSLPVPRNFAWDLGAPSGSFCAKGYRGSSSSTPPHQNTPPLSLSLCTNHLSKMFSLSSIRMKRQQKKDKSINSVSARPRTPSWHCKSQGMNPEWDDRQTVERRDLDKFGQLRLVRTLEGIESRPLYRGSKSTTSVCSLGYTPSMPLLPSSQSQETNTHSSSSGRAWKAGQKVGKPSHLGQSRFSRALPPLPIESPSQSDLARSLIISMPESAIGGSAPDLTCQITRRKPDWAVWDACFATPVDVQETFTSPCGSSMPDLTSPLMSSLASPRSRADTVPSLSSRPPSRKSQVRLPLTITPIHYPIPSHLKSPTSPVTPPSPTTSISDRLNTGPNRSTSTTGAHSAGTSHRNAGCTNSFPIEKNFSLDSPVIPESPKPFPSAPYTEAEPASKESKPHTATLARRNSTRRSVSFGTESDVDKLARGLQELSAIFSSKSTKGSSDSSDPSRIPSVARHTIGRQTRTLSVHSITEENEHEDSVNNLAMRPPPLGPPPVTNSLRSIPPLRINKCLVSVVSPSSGKSTVLPSSLPRRRTASDPSLGCPSSVRKHAMVGRSPLSSKLNVPLVTPEVEEPAQRTPNEPSQSSGAPSVRSSTDMSNSSSTTTSQGHSTDTSSSSASEQPRNPSLDKNAGTHNAQSTTPMATTQALADNPANNDQNASPSIARFQRPTAPLPSFESLPIAWQGLPLEAAKWIYTGEHMDRIVYKAIHSSTENSSIRLLSPEVLERDVSNEIFRLELQRADIKARFNAQIRRRRVLLRSLPLYMEGSEPETAGRLINQLEECSEACDKLSEELFQVTDQLGQLTVLTMRHDASALCLGIQKLGRSYKEVRGTNIGLQLELATVEAERDEAWALAEELEQKVKQSRYGPKENGRQSEPNTGCEPAFAWPAATLPLSVAATRQTSFRVRSTFSSGFVKADLPSSKPDGFEPNRLTATRCNRVEAKYAQLNMVDASGKHGAEGRASRSRAFSDSLTNNSRPSSMTSIRYPELSPPLL